MDERGQEVVGGGGLLLGDPDGAEDVFAATRDAPQFVPGDPLRVHLNDVWKRGLDGRTNRQ